MRAYDRQGRIAGEASGVAQIEAEAAPAAAPASTPAATSLGWLTQFKGLNLTLRLEYPIEGSSGTESQEFRIPPDTADWMDQPVQWNGASFQGTYTRKPQRDSPGTTEMIVSGTLREAPDRRIYLDFYGQIVDTMPDSRNASGRSSTYTQECRLKDVPLLSRHGETEYALWTSGIEGDDLRRLAPVLTVTASSGGSAKNPATVVWRRSQLRLEFTRGIRTH